MLNTFATGLLQDLHAVAAGLTLDYSSGAVERHNNKVKVPKRQMFGRAGFDLLRLRVARGLRPGAVRLRAASGLRAR